jgi:hypothetical protein
MSFLRYQPLIIFPLDASARIRCVDPDLSLYQNQSSSSETEKQSDKDLRPVTGTIDPNRDIANAIILALKASLMPCSP